MPNPDRQTKSETYRTEQGVLNNSFDEVYKVLATVILGEYNNALYRLQVDSQGNLKSNKPSTATKIDDTTTSNVIYIGKAAPGSTASSAVWQIKKLDTSSLALETTWADGNDNFDNVWNNRATTVSYS